MARPKNEKRSADIDAQIRQLEGERRRVIIAEDQRRGAIIREALSGKSGDQLRELLRPLVAPRETFLFGLEPAKQTRAMSNSRESQESSGAADRSGRAAVAG